VHPYVQSKLPGRLLKHVRCFQGELMLAVGSQVASRDGTSCIDIQQIATFHKLMCLTLFLGFRSFV